MTSNQQIKTIERKQAEIKHQIEKLTFQLVCNNSKILMIQKREERQ